MAKKWVKGKKNYEDHQRYAIHNRPREELWEKGSSALTDEEQ